MQNAPLRLIVACVLGALLLGACGNGDDGALDDVGTPDDEPAVVAIVGVDYAFEGVPATVDSRTELTLENQSEVEIHEIVALKVADDETRSAPELLQLPPEQQGDVATMVAVQVVFPDGESVEPYGPVVLEEPGRYILACFIPEGADPDEFREAMAEATEGPPDVAGGPPHFTLGMFAELTVSS